MTEEEKKERARQRSRKYYQKNKKKILEKQKEYVKKKYATDEEFRKKAYERSRKYVKNNQEKVREMKRNWARKHYKELREKGLLKPSKSEIIENLQARINKAIEYIERVQESENDINPYILHAPTLLSILKEEI